MVALREGRRQLLDGFADDFEFSNDGAGCFVVGKERLETHPRHEGLDALDGMQDILQVE
jgi:hypothetical protein